MWLQKFIYFFKNFGYAKIGGFGDGGGKIAPEPAKDNFVILPPAGNIIQFFFQLGGEIITDIPAEIIFQKCRHQPAFVFGDQAVFFLAHIFAGLDGGDHRGIGGRAANAQFFHAFDQRGLGIARWWLGEMLFRGHGLFGRCIAVADLRQAFIVALVFLVVAAFLVDFQKPLKQHHLARGAQADLTIV